jgi:hypothetical protein
VSWETRADCPNGRYYTRNRTFLGRRYRQYFGKGPVAEKAAAEDLARRKQREARRADRALYDGAVDRHKEFSSQVALLMQAALYSVGLYQHERGAWRRRGHVQSVLSRASATSR